MERGLRLANTLVLVCAFLISPAQQWKWLIETPRKGDGVSVFLNRYGVNASCARDSFFVLNQLRSDQALLLGKKYFLPIKVYTYNDVSIRTTIGTSNWDQALKIQQYNNDLHEKGVKQGLYTINKELWVPMTLFCVSDEMEVPPKNKISEKEIIVPLFGPEWEKVTVTDQELKGHVYYIVSGHGGPDPGAMGEKDGNILCEDEYAYDVSIRLARNLMSHGAIVHMIIQDPDDGIREEAYLKPDKDEVCSDGKTLPLNQLERLKQRTREVNQLYAGYKKRKDISHQRVIIVHVDSRQEGQKIDLFFYHHPSSEKAKSLANTMLETVKSKYDEHQKSRGYSGVVKERNLYVLREMHPVAVYIELGNITNPFDQKRLIVPNNRQALANWFTYGIMKHMGNP